MKPIRPPSERTSKRSGITAMSRVTLPRFPDQVSRQIDFRHGEMDESGAGISACPGQSERRTQLPEINVVYGLWSIGNSTLASIPQLMASVEVAEKQLCMELDAEASASVVTGHSLIRHSYSYSVDRPFRKRILMFYSEATLVSCRGLKVKLKSGHGTAIKRRYCLFSSQRQ